MHSTRVKGQLSMEVPPVLELTGAVLSGEVCRQTLSDRQGLPAPCSAIPWGPLAPFRGPSRPASWCAGHSLAAPRNHRGLSRVGRRLGSSFAEGRFRRTMRRRSRGLTFHSSSFRRVYLPTPKRRSMSSAMRGPIRCWAWSSSGQSVVLLTLSLCWPLERNMQLRPCAWPIQASMN